jgi:hypothetical protein
VLFKGYAEGAFSFWAEEPLKPWERKAVHWLQRLSRRINRQFDRPNWLASPYMVLIAER